MSWLLKYKSRCYLHRYQGSAAGFIIPSPYGEIFLNEQLSLQQVTFFARRKIW
jgi:hypothetical protein